MKNVNIGDWVTYEDTANPRKTYEVRGFVRYPWGSEWVLSQVDTNERKCSDLRQVGWKAYQSYVKG